jgi:Domain of unknown function (DUF4157)
MSAGARDRAADAERDRMSTARAPTPTTRPGVLREPTILAVQQTTGNRAATRLVNAARPLVEADEVRPLAPRLRDRLEQRLGANLSRVRVHHGPEAAREAARRGAVAFTRGRDVFLGETVEPNDPHVLAHEAAHTVQQAAAGAHDAPAALEAEAQAAGAGGSTVTGSAPFGSIQKLDAPEPPLTEQEMRWADDWLLPRLGRDKSWKENIGGEQAARIMRLHSGVAHRFAGDAEFREWRRAGGKPQAVAPVQPWGAGGAGETAEPAATTETAVEEPGVTEGGRGQVPAGTVQIQPSNVDLSFDEAGSRWVVTVDGAPAAAVEVPSKQTRVDINVTTDDRGNLSVAVDGPGRIVPLTPAAAKPEGPATSEAETTGTSEARGFTRSEVEPMLVEGARRPKTQEELFKESWARNTTPQQKAEAAQLGPPPIYYTKEMRELDAPPEIFEAADMFLPLPVFTTGWRGAEAIWGETLSGVPVDQAAAAKSIATELAMSIVLDTVGGAIIGRLLPADEIVEAGLRSGDDLADDAIRRSTTLGDVPPARPRPPTPQPKAPAATPATLADVPPAKATPAVPAAPNAATPQAKVPAPAPTKLTDVPPAKTPASPAAASAPTSQPKTAGPTAAAAAPLQTAAQKPWHAADLTPDEVLAAYRKAGVKKPLPAKKVRAKAKEGYRFDPSPGGRRWTKPNKPVKLPGVEQEAGRLQEKVVSEITGWPKNTTAHTTRFGDHIPDYLVKRDKATGKWVTAASPSDAQVIADSKYYDATVVQLDDQIKGFVQMARRTNVPGQRMLLLMTNENAKVAEAVHRYAAKQRPKVVVRQIKQRRSP